MGVDRRDLVSASEIAAWEWCPEAWRLDALGMEATNQADRLRGKKHHAGTAFVEVWSRRLVWCGFVLLVLAAAIAALSFALGRGGE